LSQYLQATVTILSLVNPVICATIFAKITAGKSTNAKMGDATKATLAIIVILGLAALGGAQLLKVFGITLPAFQTAGGMVLVWMGFIMLRGDASPTSASSEDNSDDTSEDNASLSPLILFAASPGTITGVITLSVAHSQHAIPTTALVAIVIALAVTWLIMLVTSRAGGQRKQGLMHDVTSRFMGLIVLAMGVQFALSGCQQFFRPK
jgi:multiple antibiotic resistance protein